MCLVAIGIGGICALCALNRTGRLPSEDVLRECLCLDPPLLPNRPPIVEFIVSRLPKVECPLLWDIVVDDIFLEALVGVDRCWQVSGI